jgi:hypothetical protein
MVVLSFTTAGLPSPARDKKLGDSGDASPSLEASAMSTFLCRTFAVRLLDKVFETQIDRAVLGQSSGIAGGALAAFRSGASSMPGELRSRRIT